MMTPTSENIFEKKEIDPNADLASSLEWLHKNTNFPTLAEFMANPDKYRERPEEIFESIDSLHVEWKNKVAKVKYYWRGEYECKSLSKLYDIARNEGLGAGELEMEPTVEPLFGTSNDHDSQVVVIVNVWPKKEFQARGGVIANE